MRHRVLVRQGGRLRDLPDLLPEHGRDRVISEVRPFLNGLVLAGYRVPAAEIRDYQHTSHIAAAISSPSCRYWWRDGIRTGSTLVGPGSVFVCSQQSFCQTGWDGPIHVLGLTIGIEQMEQALPEPFTKRPVTLRSIAAPDEVLSHLIGAIEGEARAGYPAGKLLVESLANTVALYLAARYGTDPCIMPAAKSGWGHGLSRERLVRVTEYIEAHLTCELSVVELAGVACLSSYHFGKMFQRSTGETVHRYVTRRRLERAQALIRAGKLSLPEIAEAVGFGDPSQLSRVFRRQLRITPGEWRRMAL
jgi:AraC family transcriptional regulator